MRSKSWIEDAERDEFDQMTGERIRQIKDIPKLKRLIRYMREEGFQQTADIGREVLKELGEILHFPGEEKDVDDYSELDKFVKEFDFWKASIKDADEILQAEKSKTDEEFRDKNDSNTTEGPYRTPKIRSLVCKDPKPPSVPTSTPIPTPKRAHHKKDIRSGPQYYEQWDKFANQCENDEEIIIKDNKDDGHSEECKESNQGHLSSTNARGSKLASSKSLLERKWLAQREREKGNELFKSREYNACLDAYNLSIDLFDSYAITYANRAAAYMKMNRLDKAHADCCKALELDPGYIKALVRRGLVNLQSDRPDEALKDLLEASNMDPTDQEIIRLMQKAERALKKKQVCNFEAQEQKLNSDFKRILVEEVETKGSAPEDGNLGDSVNHTTQKAQECCTTVNEKADVISTPESYSHRRKLIEEVVNRNDFPKDQQGNRNKDRGNAPEDRLDVSHDHASANFEAQENKDTLHGKRDVKSMPSSHDSKRKLIEVLENNNNISKNKDNEENKDSADESSINPLSLATEWHTAGNKYFSNGDINKAENCYTRSLKYFPNDALVLTNRALCRLKMSKFDDAVKDASVAISVDPTHTKAFHHRASAFESLGKLENALKDYKKIFDDNPSDKVAKERLESIQRQLEKAVYVPMRVGPMVIEEIQETNMACRIPSGKEEFPKPKEPINDHKISHSTEAPDTQTDSLSFSHEQADSKLCDKDSSFMKESALDEDDKTRMAVKERLEGNNHFKNGRYDLAIECYERSLQHHKYIPATFTNRAICYVKLGEYKAAENDCTEAIHIDSENMKAYYWRALAREKLGTIRGALKDLQVVLRSSSASTEINTKFQELKGKLKVDFAPTTSTAERIPDMPTTCPPSVHEIRSLIATTSDESNKRPTMTSNIGHVSEAIAFKRPLKLPDQPKTVLELERACLALQDEPKLLSQYFKSIDVSKYPRIYKESLSVDALKLIAKSLRKAFVPDDPLAVVYVLKGLSTVKRFDLIARLLHDKEDLCALFDWLKSTKVPLDDLQILKSLYCFK